MSIFSRMYSNILYDIKNQFGRLKNKELYEYFSLLTIPLFDADTIVHKNE